jgi:PAS domain S-box-containing protein
MNSILRQTRPAMTDAPSSFLGLEACSIKAPEEEIPGPAADPGTVNILLVDDRPDKLLALETILADLGQNLVKAESGREALRCLLQGEFAVILLDVNMPGMDGFETASLIRQRKNSEHTPIIFITAFNDTENHVSRGYSLGAVDYILTPVLPEVLRTKVSVFVELSKKTEQVKRQAESLRDVEAREFLRRLAETSDQLEVETKRNRFFTLSLDLLAIAGFDGHFRQLNPNWEKTLGYSERELRAHSILDLVHREERADTLERLEELKRGSSSRYFENRCRCQDGTYRWLGWTAAPFMEEQLLYLFARDITERRAAEERIRSLNDELERRVLELNESNEQLEAFTYSIAHDLRAPLRAMSGFAVALREDYSSVLGEQGRSFAERIEGSAKRMDHLILDLLAYSRLSRDEIGLNSVALDAAVAEALNELEQDVQKRTAEVQVASPLPAASAHHATVVRVLANLISNALKFVDPGTCPRVRISAEEGEAAVRVWVEDNGIGISKEHQERIFGLFQRLHSEREFPGTGIGLAIVRKGVERMRGRTGVESSAGRGSRFWIELPRAPRA